MQTSVVQKNEFLVFENIDEAVKKLAYIRRQPNSSSATVLDLFDYGEGIYTVGFSKLIERVALMLNLNEFSQNAPLRENINELTKYRNKIVHFSVEIELNRVIDLLRDILDPLLTILEKEIGDEKFVHCLPYVRASSKSIFEVSKLRHAESEERVINLIGKFSGQEIDGKLLGINGKFQLPTFLEITRATGRDEGYDILGKTKSENWLIEIKLSSFNTIMLEQMVSRKLRLAQSENDRIWLISMSSQKWHSITRKMGLLYSSLVEIEKLEIALS